MFLTSDVKTRGLTLLELIIAVFLSSALVLAVWVVYESGFKNFYFQMTRSTAKGECARFLARAVSELRQATSLSAADESAVTYAADTNVDGLVESVQLVWSGTAGAALNRISGGVTEPLVHAVQSLEFSYYDASGNALPEPVSLSSVRRLQIDVTTSENGETFRLRSGVALRGV